MAYTELESNVNKIKLNFKKQQYTTFPVTVEV